MEPLTADRHQKFVEVTTRRIRDLTAVVELVQVLSDRPQTYTYTQTNAREMYRAWKRQVQYLEDYFSPDVEDPNAEEVPSEFRFTRPSKGIEPTPERLALQAKRNLKILPVDEKNARFLALAESRVSRVLLQIRRLMNTSSRNYLPTKDEVAALIQLLKDQCNATCSLFDPSLLMSRYIARLEPIQFRFLAQNLNGRSNYTNPDLINGVVPEWSNSESIDIFAFNEVYLDNRYDRFEAMLEEAGYYTFHDSRDPKALANTCALALNSRLVPARTKLPVFQPSQKSGLDYLATLVPQPDGRALGIASVRLHSSLGKEADLAADYQDMADVALPELLELVKKLKKEGADELLIAGDFNHARIVESGNYENLAQAPISFQVQEAKLAEVGLRLLRANGTSFTSEDGRYHTAIDHIAISAGIKMNDDLRYDPKPAGSRLDHAGITGTFTMPAIDPGFEETE
ncbi:endonuclease/exonuclease/phosphatase family protein [Lacticaseibacillus hegangensis]|uniref:Endonuclease/exonuclease/phosphatase family protein n=1 Tax=Lacticaseibacillus hegangensis TaxID=2486010 RepID=A0ABW4CWA5_9LACO|nr:endonuclease/exonuclease/phosphatase family protein [Lacticaseibacillus hegangensis]